MIKRLTLLALTSVGLAWTLSDKDSAVHNLANGTQAIQEKRAYAYTVALHGTNNTLSVGRHVAFLKKLPRNQCEQAQRLLDAAITQWGKTTLNADINQQISEQTRDRC